MHPGHPRTVAGPAARLSTRRRLVIAGLVAGLVGALLAGVACAGVRQSPRAADEPDPATYLDTSTEAAPSSPPPVAVPNTASTGAQPTRKPSPSRRPPISPSRKPTQIALPPPPPSPTKTTNCPTFTGPLASLSAVKSALDTAAGRSYWGSIPTIKVPATLLYAIAWQESSWRSTVVACDGGIGTMQVMPDTATWMNNRFGTSYDVNTLAGNTSLGAQYLAWLIRYLGDVFFGGVYDLAEEALLDSVISAYNVGFGAVDPTKGRDGIPNWWYVDNVKTYLVSCPCLS